ncbi:MAG: hypothetical protein KF778_08500 [Rhodocyclaceae bacterium]|nr:hypothetical protein [Rhodocyclaceae bacterium]MBX3668427.1 hypothetical protein [Rhodocyclaceae bacterium]
MKFPAVLIVLALSGAAGAAEPVLTPSQVAYLRAETQKAQEKFVGKLVRITGLPQAKVREAIPAEGRITDPVARIVAAVEQKSGKPLSDEQKQAIAAAEHERQAAIQAAQRDAHKQ